MSGPILTVFRSRLRDEPDASPGFRETAEQLEASARAMPGFVDFKEFTAADGERVALITFASRDAHDAWRDAPEHRAAQQRGRAEWYETYSIQVCELVAERSFVHGSVEGAVHRP